MHEVGLMREALEIAERCAMQRGAKRICRLVLSVGAQSGVAREALEFAFEALAPTTMLDGAQLDILHVPVVCHCAACKSEFLPDSFIYVCPRCGTLSSDVLCGRDLEVATIEAE